MNESSERRTIGRRELLLGAGLAAAALPACGAEAEDPFDLEKPPVPGAASWLRGEERTIASSCAQCPAGCGIRVRVVEGRAVKIEGNPDCTVNRGGIGPRGLSGTQVLYDPDRVRGPLRRKGARGAPDFEPIGWDEALALVAERLKSLRAKGEAHRAAFVCGRERGMMLDLWRRFAQVYGSPNFHDGMFAGNGPIADAVFAMQGVREIPAYDWTATHCVLSLGSGILESSCQLVYFARAQAWMRRGEAGVRARIVHAGVALSRTAMNADEWIRIRPGTYAAFALGLAHVLVRDGLHDAGFVRDHGFGFERWKGEDGVEHAGFQDLLADYDPAKAAAICGIEGKEIERVARDLAAARPSFAVAGVDELRAPNGLATAMAVHALNALLGAIDRPGGVLVQRAAPLEDWPAFEADDAAQKSLEAPRLDGAGSGRSPLATSVLDALPAALRAGKPYALDSLFLYYSNPVYSRPDPRRWREALAAVPWIVTFTPFLDETASEFADLVLPDASYLERHEDAAPAPSVGTAVFGLRQPCVAPLFETRATGDVVIQLAHAVGEPLEPAFPFKDFRDAMKKRYVGVWKAKRGSIVEESGAEFLKRLDVVGWWNDEGYPFGRYEDVLRTPSGRFEFSSQSIRRALSAAGAGTGDLDRACLPRHEEIAWSGDPSRYPCVLLLYQPSTYAEGSGANLPWLQELGAHVGRPPWTTEAEIHTDTAATYGIRDGDRVEIESPIGKIVARAFVGEGIAPGVVRVPQGGGHTAFGRFAAGWGANPMELVDPDAMDPVTGVPAHCATRVAIRRARA
jgi:anaerobic selenocysteine-containing dehydrogenase